MGNIYGYMYVHHLTAVILYTCLKTVTVGHSCNGLSFNVCNVINI